LVQITNTLPCLRTTLQWSQIGFTLGFTFIPASISSGLVYL
jgi:hypothetical protein